MFKVRTSKTEIFGQCAVGSVAGLVRQFSSVQWCLLVISH